MLRTVVVLLMLGLVSGCAGGREDRLDHAKSIASPHRLTFTTVQTPTFTLAAFVRNPDAGQPVVIYIEGDGLAWLSRSKPSSDPTPRNPMGLQLAALDSFPNVIALARPCQYVGSTACQPAYWTSKRFAEEVVAATSAAVDRLIHAGQPVHLVGYSGGGGIAALVAARRADVASLRTVAGNLDHETISRIHEVSPMVGSLNPRDAAVRLATLPQIHYVGLKDSTVPPQVAESFLRAMGKSSCATVVGAKGSSHDSGWMEYWPSAMDRIPSCQ